MYWYDGLEGNDKYILARPNMFTTLYELGFNADYMDGVKTKKSIVRASEINIDLAMAERVSYSNKLAIANTDLQEGQTFRNRVIMRSVLNFPVSRLDVATNDTGSLDVNIDMYCDGPISSWSARKPSITELDIKQQAMIKDIINVRAAIWVANIINICLYGDSMDDTISISQSKDLAMFEILKDRRRIFERIENNVSKLVLTADRYGYRLIRDRFVNYTLDIMLPRSRFQDLAKIALGRKVK